MSSLLELLLDRAAAFIPVLLSLTVHEWAHAWTAWRLGDDTAKMLGRLSLNPVDHIDPVGTLLLPLLGVPFGWAKPVPINPVRFRRSISMPMGVLLKAAAGPISNLLLAAAACLALAALSVFASPGVSNLLGPSGYGALVSTLQFLVIINVVLACFNLLPIPPLDGSRIVDAILPAVFRPAWSRLSAMGPLLLLAVILLPALLGVSAMAWPVQWAAELAAWAARR
jgi:Zn-dependent protease